LIGGKIMKEAETLRLLDGQVDIILRALELYAY